MLLIGSALALVNANGVKLLSAWFPPQKVGTRYGDRLGLRNSENRSYADASGRWFHARRELECCPHLQYERLRWAVCRIGHHSPSVADWCYGKKGGKWADENQLSYQAIS